jgi:hypothetical protein
VQNFEKVYIMWKIKAVEENEAWTREQNVEVKECHTYDTAAKLKAIARTIKGIQSRKWWRMSGK